MSISIRHLAGALVLLPLAATAQSMRHQHNPADANAPVPASAYVSAFKNYSAMANEDASPDKVWRAANAEVQNAVGQSGHMTEPGSREAVPAGTSAKSEGADTQEGKTVPPVNPHAAHGGHHGKGE